MSEEKKLVPIKGIEKLYYAVITQDTSGGLTYDTPVYLKGVKKVQMSPIYSEGVYYEESKLAFEEKSLDGYDVVIDITDVKEEDLEKLFGYDLCTEGGYMQGGNDVGKEVALLMKAKKAFGQYRYIILFKGRLTPGEITIEGEEGSPNYQAQTLAGKFIATTNTGKIKYTVDSDSPDAHIEDRTFFANVMKPNKKPAPEVA